MAQAHLMSSRMSGYVHVCVFWNACLPPNMVTNLARLFLPEKKKGLSLPSDQFSFFGYINFMISYAEVKPLLTSFFLLLPPPTEVNLLYKYTVRTLHI